MRSLKHPDPKAFTEPLQEALQEQEPHLRSWAGILAEYTGNPVFIDPDPVAVASAELTRGSDRPWVNYLASTANTIVPSLLSRDPRILALPTRPEFEGAAKAQEVAANYLAKKVGVLPVVQEALLDSLLFGIGVVKVGWDDDAAGALTIADYVDGEEAQVEADALDGMDEERAARIREVLQANDIPTTTSPKLPTARRVAPWNFFIAPGAASPAESPWVAERILVSDDDLRAVPFFKIPKDLQPDTALVQTPLNPGNVQTQRDPTHHTVYEIRYWNTTSKGRQRRAIWLRTSGSGVEDATVLAHIVDPVKCPGWPYEYIQSLGAPGTWYRTQTADLASIREMANRLNEEWSYVLRHHRLSSRRKYLFGPGIDQDKLRDWLESDEDMVGMQASTDDVRNAVAILPEAPPPSDTSSVIQGLRSLMYEVSGIDAFQRGALPNDTTATAAKLANQSTQGRMVYRLVQVENFYARIIKRIVAYFGEFATEDLVVRVAGDSGTEFMRYAPGKVGYGDYEIEIELGSAMPRDPRSQQESFMALLQSIQAVTAALTPAIQAGALAPEALSTFIARAFDVFKEDPSYFDGTLGKLTSPIFSGQRNAGVPANPATGAAPGVAQALPGVAQSTVPGVAPALPGTREGYNAYSV